MAVETNAELAAQVRSVGIDAGLAAVGVAQAEPFDDVRQILEERRDAGLSDSMQFTYRNPARSSDPTRALPDARSLVVGALPYPGEVSRPDGDGPFARVARYAATDHYATLRSALSQMTAPLAEAGWRTRILADDNALVDRAAAQRAGIGWYGKNANLLVPGHGSWVVLGAVLTDAPLPVAEGPVPDGCGACRRCIDGCPTGAIVAPGVVDARRCLAWLVQATGAFPRQHRVALGDRIYGCDDCQEVCPPSRRSGAGSETGQGAWVDLVELLTADDATLLDRHGRWYVPRRDPRYLRRNALLALGNAADPVDPRVVDVLERHLAHDDGLVRAHAVWAARRLGREDLLERLVGADDPWVVEELAADAPPARQ